MPLKQQRVVTTINRTMKVKRKWTCKVNQNENYKLNPNYLIWLKCCHLSVERWAFSWEQYFIALNSCLSFSLEREKSTIMKGSHLGGKVSSLMRSPCYLKYLWASILYYLLYYLAWYVLYARTTLTPDPRLSSHSRWVVSSGFACWFYLEIYSIYLRPKF